MDIWGNISYRIPEQRMSSLSEGENKTFFSFPVFELVSYCDGRNKPTILGKIARMTFGGMNVKQRDGKHFHFHNFV